MSAAGLWGLLVGDAFGVPYEFHSPSALPARSALAMTPPPGFARAHHGTPPGTWSDDGAQALALLASLVACGGLDPDDLGRRLVAWYRRGDYAVDARVFDVGIQTRRALGALEAGVPALQAGPSGEYDNGNGSLMRVLPLALWHRGDDAALVEDAHQQSRVTHGHARSQAACALTCLWARRLAGGADSEVAFADAAAALAALYQDRPEFAAELSTQLVVEGTPGGSGYVVDTVRSARWALRQGSYEDVVRAAVSLGNDTDTTACVAGGLAAVRDGMGAIPGEWLAALRGQEIVRPLAAALG